VAALIAAACVVLLCYGLAVNRPAPDQKQIRPWIMALCLLGGGLGLWFRLHDLDRSLWLDEFGTLWAIEAGVDESWSRVVSFHGQTPFYYLLLWPVVHLAGESEWALRLPSLLFGTAATALVFATANRLHSREAAWLAALISWISFPMVEASANARAYALALACAALALFGFVSRVSGAGRWSRVCFVLGGAGLFLSHYLSSLAMAGVLAGYLLFRELRDRYPPRAFALDVSAQVALSVAGLPQVVALWRRRDGLAWIGDPDYGLALAILLPFLTPAAVTILLRVASSPLARAAERTLWLAIGGQVIGLSAAALLGTNLLAQRYLVVVSVPAAVLGGVALARLPTRASALALGHSLVIFLGVAAVAWQTSGLPTTAPRHDWREAVALLEADLARHPETPVLYRPGFVEQTPGRTIDRAMLAPLRGPGRAYPDWRIVPLTFSWWTPGREAYFENVLVPVLESHARVYFLSSGYSDATGDYTALFVEWLDRRLPGEFVRRPLGSSFGVDVLVLERSAPAATRE
jgi:4-amino-4-deoxy-L-arabinose transferase-like glycosyltransferase